MTLVKICGITNAEDAQTGTVMGADFLGFVFFEKSPRNVNHEKARDIIVGLRRASREKNPLTVGVFVDETPAAIAQTMDYCGLDYAQLHGSEPTETVDALREQDFGVFKAFRVQDGVVARHAGRYRAAAYLLDTYVPGQPGGTGQCFDWTLAVQMKTLGRIILAGGLTPDNVRQAVRIVQPWAVDVSSGVEASPGRKDPDKIRRFIQMAKTVDQGEGNDDQPAH